VRERGAFRLPPNDKADGALFVSMGGTLLGGISLAASVGAEGAAAAIPAIGVCVGTALAVGEMTVAVKARWDKGDCSIQ